MIRPRPPLVLLLGVLVLLAGCNGFGPGQRSTQREAYDVPPGGPEGIGADGSVDAEALVAQHRSIVEERSVTIRERRSQTFVANGTTRYRVNATSRHAPGGRYLVVQRARAHVPLVGGSRRVTLRGWSNGSVRVAARVANDSTLYGRYGVGRAPGHERRLSGLFSSLDPELARETTHDGETVYVLRADRDPDAIPVAGAVVSNVSNATFVVRVDEDGLIRSYRLAYDGTVNGDRVRVRLRVRYVNLGSTTVPRPAWVDRALNRTDGDAGSPD